MGGDRDVGVQGARVDGLLGAGSVGTSIAYASLIRGAARHIALYDIADRKSVV